MNVSDTGMRGNGLHALTLWRLIDTYQRPHGAFRFGAAEDMAGGQAVILRIWGPDPPGLSGLTSRSPILFSPMPAFPTGGYWLLATT